MTEKADRKQLADSRAPGGSPTRSPVGERAAGAAAGGTSDGEGQEAGRGLSPPTGQESPAAASSSSVDKRRALPAVGRILNRPAVASLVQLYGRDAVSSQLRVLLEGLREGGIEGLEEAPSDDLEGHLEGLLEAHFEAGLGASLRRVINATGILLHTNLGRAPLPRAVAASLPPLLNASCDLELDLERGTRGQRNRRSDALLTALTGAERGLVVNNNAAALVLALNTLARGREVLVSRGELVEIGGSFRVPAILEAAGTRLVEVGTTNRTRIADFRDALGENTGLILKVHPSNYRITGFVEETTTAELAALSRESGVVLLVDEGAGLLRPSKRPEFETHESVREHLIAGADLVCGSGDKLLGGPQAGLLVGDRRLIERLERNPLYRALRPDRTALAALEAVLRARLAGDAMPIDGLWPDARLHSERLERVASGLRAAGLVVQPIAAEAFVGGGALPEVPIPGEALAVDGGERLARRLRLGPTPVVGYLREGRLILDLRTVDPADDDALVAAVAWALCAGEGS